MSGEYQKDLNRTNPLGTGGELATEFAKLMAEMWGVSTPSERRNLFPKHENSYLSTVQTSVYPRDFKVTLGKHAEQFIGYDQHDSQELATYLLDALHEDTNRVAHKPYIEKPEQGEDEDDDEAAQKAWDLHLKREDSKVVETFVGQVKSRVQCCEEGCGRVSTTFDPSMYLSVPIPGSMDRTLRVTFVPLNPERKFQSFKITLKKTSTLSKFINKAAETLMKAGWTAPHGRPFAMEDLCAVDIWNHEVYHWYEPNDAMDRIRDSDETYLFELMPLSGLKKQEEDSGDNKATESSVNTVDSVRSRTIPSRFRLDIATNKEMYHKWQDTLHNNYVKQKLKVLAILNEKRTPIAGRIEFFHKMVDFFELCIREMDKAGNKRAREEEEEEQSFDAVEVSPEEDDVPALIEKSAESDIFDIKTRFDLAILQVCIKQLRRTIVNEPYNENKNKDSADECCIEVFNRPSSNPRSHVSHEKAPPIVIRIPGNMTVYGLREELAKRFKRSLKLDQLIHPRSEAETVEDNSQQGNDLVPMEGDSDRGDFDSLPVESMNLAGDEPGGDPALLIMRQIPLSYLRKPALNGHKNVPGTRMGSLEKESSYVSSPPISLASPTHDSEQEQVADLVGPKGVVFLEWPASLFERVFDVEEFSAVDALCDPDEEAVAARNQLEKRTTNVVDCIEKYCQMEQLEETEMWYCDKCKQHVRAWKQFHLYKTPPILIIHLKRFQYSASTHRRDKISTFIDFPLTDLDLTSQVTHWTEGEKPVYDCYAVR